MAARVVSKISLEVITVVAGALISQIWLTVGLAIIAVALVALLAESLWHRFPNLSRRQKIIPIAIICLCLFGAASAGIWMVGQNHAAKPQAADAPGHSTPNPSASPHSDAPTPDPSPTGAELAPRKSANLKHRGVMADNITQSGNIGITIGKVGTINAGPSSQQMEVQRRVGVVRAIVFDWTNSNDGVPPTDAEILDKAADYINSQLRIRGEKWQFNRETRRQMGFPPAAGDTYEHD